MQDHPDMPDTASPVAGWMIESLDAAGLSTRCDEPSEEDMPT